MWLVIKHDKNLGSPGVAVPLKIGRTVIGRLDDCDIVLLSRNVSRKHLEINTGSDGSVRFRDLDSSTGVFLNDEQVQSGGLEPGDTLIVGDSFLTLHGKPPARLFKSTSRKKQQGHTPATLSGRHKTDWLAIKSSIENLRRASDSKELLEKLLSGLLSLLKADRGYVLLKPQGEDKLVPVASHSIDDTDFFINVSKTISRRALETGRTVFIFDSKDDELCAHSHSLALQKERLSIICGPLKTDGKAFGIIYLDMKSQDRIFDGGLVEIFETVVGLASERLAAQRIRNSLLKTRGVLQTMNRLAWERDQFMFGPHPDSQSLRRLISSIADQDVSVLIQGETGTGKEMVARAVHRKSSRRDNPFVPVNCAAIPRDMFESELFGSEKGAFTGATKVRRGRFELASGGTLFLDEVGEIPLEFQTKLLRVLEQRSIHRLGGERDIPVDFRLICATNRDLAAAVNDGAFRSDFYFRINVFGLLLSPLRKRKADIIPLARHFLRIFVLRSGKSITGFSEEALNALTAHEWPGNVRELKNAVERAVVVETKKLVQASSLPLASSFADAPLADSSGSGQNTGGDILTSMPLDFTLAREIFEEAFIKRSLEKNKGNISAVVRETGLARGTVYRWLERYGLIEKK